MAKVAFSLTNVAILQVAKYQDLCIKTFGTYTYN